MSSYYNYDEPPLSRVEALLRDIKEQGGGGGGGGGGINLEYVDVLPTTNISLNTIYFLKKGVNAQGNNNYEEYVYHLNQWELIGIATDAIDNEFIDSLFS